MTPVENFASQAETLLFLIGLQACLSASSGKSNSREEMHLKYPRNCLIWIIMMKIMIVLLLSSIGEIIYYRVQLFSCGARNHDPDQFPRYIQTRYCF